MSRVHESTYILGRSVDDEEKPVSAIDRRADRPVYKQVADDVRRRIAAGEFAPGTALPSEPVLSRQYDGISRTLIRQGLGILKYEGVIHSRHGKGWFVRARRPVHRLTSTRYQATLDLPENHRDQRFLSPLIQRRRASAPPDLKRGFSEVPADDELAEVLQVPVGTMLLRRERTVIVDGRPHRRSHSYLILDMVRGTPITHPDESQPVDTLTQLDRLGIRVTAVDELVGARMPTPEESLELDIEEGVPVLTMRRTMFLDDKPVEACVDIVLPADRGVLHYRTNLRTRSLPRLHG
jgi:GntR family transcriptional regulator